MIHDKTDKPLGALFSDLTRDIVSLMRKEIALARSEVSEKVSEAQSGITSIAIGAAVILAGLFVLLQAVVNGLAMVLPPDMAPWLAPLIVGLVVALIGYLMLKSGQSHLKPANLMPERTINSLRTDKAVAQEKAR
jgi:xanthine/uracil permease